MDMFIRFVRIGPAGLAYTITYVMIGMKNHDLFLNTSDSCADTYTASDGKVADSLQAKPQYSTAYFHEFTESIDIR